MQCTACFAEVDGRKKVTCNTCGAVLHKECAINHDGVTLCDVCFVVSSTEKNSKFGDFELPESIRRTYIEIYKSCPYKFYQEVIKGHHAPQNEYTQVGIDVHKIIEDAITNGLPHKDAIALMQSIFDKYPDELFKNKTREEMWQRAEDSIDTFYEVILPTLSKPLAIEKTLITNIGDNIPKLQITMDLITEANDGELELHDWKTGQVMVGKKLSSDLQAPLYIYSVQEHFNRPVKTFTFYYLQENKVRTFVRSETNPDRFTCTVGKREYHISLMDAIREVKSIFSKIKKGQFDPTPETPVNYYTRNTCHLREKGLCCQDVDPWNQI